MTKLAFRNPTPSYERLLDTIHKRPRPIVAWVGAGLSAPAGLPSWKKLREELENELEAMAQATPPRRAELGGRLGEIRRHNDPWKAFGLLQNALGEATFRASIREKLAPALKVPVPELYTELWRLPVNGMINLNIDRLAQRALTLERPGQHFIERHGRSVTTLIGRITQDTFIANLHGFFEDPDTWVFTDFQRSELLKDPRYHEFVRDCAKYCTIVMIGISADDSAVLDHFVRASIDGLPLETHYWLTDRVDVPAEVEKYGISVIRYDNSDGQHRALMEFAQDASRLSPSLMPPPVVTLAAPGSPMLRSPNEMVALAPNLIRAELNSAAAAILANSNDETYEEFDAFCKKYARPILNAGYVSNDPSEEADTILNYRVSKNSEDKEGAFGKVWRATDDEGRDVALKIFRYEVREKPGLLRAFRRGIRSLRILSEHGLPGIVGFKAASEIPPVVVMEWVEGLNLQEAVPTHLIKSWPVRTRIARDLARIIFSAHNVPERVLHRDIRPANIMLRDFFQDPDTAELVVLDFDLSWHVGSLEQSVFAGTGSPYLAPEQFAAVKGATSRSAAVDSFGYGMTLFFLLTGQEPGSAFRSDWAQSVKNAVGGQRYKEWMSLPARLCRLIFNCTKIDQNQRPLFSQIVYEMETMFDALDSPETVRDMGFLAEEVLARAPDMVGYESIDSGGFVRNSPSGLRVELGPSTSADSAVTLRIIFQQVGTERFHNLAAIGDYFKKIRERLTKEQLTSNSGGKVLTLSHGSCILEVDVYLESYSDFLKFCAVFVEFTGRLSTIVARWRSATASQVRMAGSSLRCMNSPSVSRPLIWCSRSISIRSRTMP